MLLNLPYKIFLSKSLVQRERNGLCKRWRDVLNAFILGIFKRLSRTWHTFQTTKSNGWDYTHLVVDLVSLAQSRLFLLRLATNTFIKLFGGENEEAEDPKEDRSAIFWTRIRCYFGTKGNCRYRAIIPYLIRTRCLLY